jgi:hypothetical protein
MSARRPAWSPRSPSPGQPEALACLWQCALALVGLLAHRREPYRGHHLRQQMRPRIRSRPVTGLKLRWPNLAPGIRTLALLTRLLGAKLGANDHRLGDTPGPVQPLSSRPNGTSGHIQHLPGTLRKCLLSSRSRVRVAVGAQLSSTSIRMLDLDDVRWELGRFGKLNVRHGKGA